MRNATIIQTHSNVGSYNFPAIPASQIYGISVLTTQGDGTAAGTIKLQASNDFPPAGQLASFTPTNWADIPSTSQTVTAGGAVLIPNTQICYQFVRVVWTEGTPGSTVATNYINLQGF